MYGGSSAKETKFFKMFSLLAAESNRALHTFFEDFCLMGGVLFTISACRNRCWHVICPNTERCHTEYHERAKYYKQPQISWLTTVSEHYSNSVNRFRSDRRNSVSYNKMQHTSFSVKFSFICSLKIKILTLYKI